MGGREHRPSPRRPCAGGELGDDERGGAPAAAASGDPTPAGPPSLPPSVGALPPPRAAETSDPWLDTEPDRSASQGSAAVEAFECPSGREDDTERSLRPPPLPADVRDHPADSQGQAVSTAAAPDGEDPEVGRKPPRERAAAARLRELQRELQECDDSASRARLLLRVGELSERLRDDVTALAAFRGALLHDPRAVAAADGAQRVCHEPRERAELAALLLECVERLDEPSEQLSLLMRVAALYREDDDVDRAVVVLETANSFAVADPEVERELSRLQARQRARLVPAPSEILGFERALETENDASRRAAIYCEMAALWRAKPDQWEREAESLERAVALDRHNEQAFGRLTQVYREAREYGKLLRLLQARIEVTPGYRARLLREVAELYDGPLERPVRAIEVYLELYTLDRDDLGSLRALARLTQQLQAWDRAEDALSRLARRADNVAERVEALHQLGRIYQGPLDDELAAERCFSQALELDPSDPGCLGELLALYRSRGDWGKAVQAMQRGAERASNSRRRALLFFEAALGALHHLEDRDLAEALFEQTLECDENHIRAADQLADLYLARERFDQLGEVLQLLHDRRERLGRRLRARTDLRLGLLAEQRGEMQRALEHFRSAHAADDSDQAALHGVARALVATEQWQAAFDTYRTLIAGEQPLTGEELVEALYQAGRSAQALGYQRRGRALYGRVLELVPRHEGALEALAELQAEGRDFEAALRAKQAMLEQAQGQRRFELLLQIGDLLGRELRRLDAAVAAYREALEIDPDSRAVLSRLIDVYSEAERWEPTVEACLRLAQLERKPAVRSRYFAAAAVFCRDKLGDPVRALDHYEQALDCDPRQLKCFEAIDKICTRRRDWKRLERAYGRMIKRLDAKANPRLAAVLWHNLGEVLRTRRRDFEGAIAAFEAALRLEPNDQRRRILAELYLLVGSRYRPKAIDAHHALIDRAPHDIALYHELYRLYLEVGRYDPAWCICAALVLLGKADPGQQHFYQQHRRRHMVRATKRITSGMWRGLLEHPDQDPMLGALFAALVPLALSLYERPVDARQLKSKDRLDPADDGELVRRLAYLRSVLDVPAFEIYTPRSAEGGVDLIVDAGRPVLLVGRDLVSAGGERATTFMLANALSRSRPDVYLREVCGSLERLQQLYLAACKLFDSEVSIPGRMIADVDALAAQLQAQAHPSQFEQLRSLAKRARGRSHADLEQWWYCVRSTSERCGLLLSQDLELAVRLTTLDASGILPPQRRVRRLLQFAVSQSYFELRDKLGLQLESFR